ncbi:MAG: 50S ribosomal protein L13 [Chloroflexota bacterium]|jgi:large subunit ribosomal protein L13|nr:50S ribosomal protein L13 [Chloroflexota bacterium]
MVTNKTYAASAADIKKNWYVVNADGQTLGRLSSKIAKVIIGKHKATYTPNVDCGDFVVVVNASKVKVTGNRLDDKKYYRHSTYTGGGLKVESLGNLLGQGKVDKIIRAAVWGMIPHNRLGRRMITKLKVYGGSDHPHVSQNPQEMTI